MIAGCSEVTIEIQLQRIVESRQTRSMDVCGMARVCQLRRHTQPHTSRRSEVQLPG